MSDVQAAIGRLRGAVFSDDPTISFTDESDPFEDVRTLLDEIMRLRNILCAPLSSAEMKLVDKHCDWSAFKHAWNAVMKNRLNQQKPE